MSTKKKTAKKKPARKPKKKPKKKAPRKSFLLERSRARGTLASIPNLWVLLQSLGSIVFSGDSAVVVKFNDQGKVNQVTAHRSTDDRVWFQNLGLRDHSFDLDHWPFLGPAKRLTVAAGKTLGPFTLDPADTYVGTITFINNVPVFGSQGGPGDPQWDTDG